MNSSQPTNWIQVNLRSHHELKWIDAPRMPDVCYLGRKTRKTFSFCSSLPYFEYNHQYIYLSFHCCPECVGDDRRKNETTAEGPQVQYRDRSARYNWFCSWKFCSARVHRFADINLSQLQQWFMLIYGVSLSDKHARWRVDSSSVVDKWRKVFSHQASICTHLSCQRK